MAVIVWFHSGGFVLGSSTGYPGGVLASFNDVLVVSVNFRLAVLGFFNVPGTDVKGNYGMLDQVGSQTVKLYANTQNYFLKFNCY